MLNDYGFKMETNIKKLEELEGLRASLSRLLVETDKTRFAVSQIAKKQTFLDTPSRDKLVEVDKCLLAACSSLSLLTASLYNKVFDYE